MPRDPEEHPAERIPNRAEDALHEDPDPMAVAAKAQSDPIPALTQILIRERQLQTGKIALLDSAELTAGVQVIVYNTDYSEGYSEIRWSLYINGHPRAGGPIR